MMKHFILATLLAAWAQALTPAQAAKPAGKGPLKVFILAGQSNMEGQAVADLEGKDYNDGKGTLQFLMRDPAKAGLFKHLRDESRPMDGRGMMCGCATSLRLVP